MAEFSIYIDSEAEDGGNGSAITPYNTFTDINWTAGGFNSIFDWVTAGDNVTINVQNDFYTGFVAGVGGGVANPITFKSYGTTRASIYPNEAYKWNQISTDYYSNGIGKNVNKGYVKNGLFVARNVDDFDSWTESITGASTVTAETISPYTGGVSAKLLSSGGRARLGQNISFTKNQKYEISFMAKSVDGGIGTARFYAGSLGLSNTKDSEGAYSIWAGYENISDLSVSVVDVGWTEKKIIVISDEINHTSTLEITTENGSGYVLIDDVRVTPLWSEFAENVWQISGSNTDIGAVNMLSVGHNGTFAVSNTAEITSAGKWFYEDAGSNANKILYLYGDTSPALFTESVVINTDVTSVAFNFNAKDRIDVLDVAIGNGHFGATNTGDNCSIKNSLVFGCSSPVLIKSDNFELSDSEIRDGDWLVYVSAGSNNKILNNKVHGAHKSPLNGEGGGISVSVFDVSGDSTGAVIAGNTVYDCEGYGIGEYGDATNHVISGMYTRNIIYDVMEGFFSMSLDNGITGSVFSFNYIHSPKVVADSAGIKLYRKGNNCKVSNNLINGFETNIFERNHSDGFVVQNNISLNPTALHVKLEAVDSVMYDHNCYYPMVGDMFSIQVDVTWITTTYTFDGWKAEISQDDNSIITDPLVLGGGKISKTSPCVNIGTRITGVNDALQKDLLGKMVYGLVNIGPDQGAGLPTTGPPPQVWMGPGMR